MGPRRLECAQEKQAARPYRPALGVHEAELDKAAVHSRAAATLWAFEQDLVHGV